MPTLADHHDLAHAFSPSAAFLARYIDSVRLQERWQVTRGTLRRYQRIGVLPKPHHALGKLWYEIRDIDRIEAALFGRGVDSGVSSVG